MCIRDRYTETCKARIDAAKAAYDKLSDTQKALVTNAKALTEAVEAYNKLDQEQKKLVEENEVPGDTGGSGDTGSTYEQPKKNNDNIPIEDSQIKEGKVYSNGDYSYKCQ